MDATVGLGGHAEAVLHTYPAVRLIGLDRDPQALELSARRLAPFGDRVTLTKAVYDELPAVLQRLNVSSVDGALFDLGISSMQVDEPTRGFSYAQDAPLDMRMDPTSPTTAEEIVNTYPPAALARILREYGEEKFARRIADAIVAERARARLTSSARLAELVRDAIPAPARRTGGHPAKRTFQALRIEVNGELASLEAALPAAVDSLDVGGRIVVLAYHSLEDRIVKRILAQRARSTAPVELPVEPPGTAPTLRLLTRGAERPSPDEVAANPRAASVRLRAAERIDPDAPTARQAAMHQPPAPRRPGHSPSQGADRERASQRAPASEERRDRGGDRPTAQGDRDMTDKGEAR